MPPSEPIIYRQATIDEIYELRFEVLRPKQSPVKLHFDGDAAAPPATWHFGAFAGTRNIACLTLFASTWENQPAIQLRGMAVAPDLQGQGIGAKLIQAARAALTSAPNVPTLWWCNARVPAISFYQRDGWQIASEEFMIETVGPHKKMIRQNP